jgi:hypothetical protein
MRKRLCIRLTCQKDQKVASDNRLRAEKGINPKPEEDGQQGAKKVQAQVNESVCPFSRLDEIHDVHAESRKSGKASAKTDYPKSPKRLRIGLVFGKPYEKTDEESSQKIDHQGWPGKKRLHEKANKSS